MPLMFITMASFIKPAVHLTAKIAEEVQGTDEL